jgi:hypothetical protein
LVERVAQFGDLVGRKKVADGKKTVAVEFVDVLLV